MATSNKDPEFYSQYSTDEISKFENILRLIHAPEPNVSLAKELVSHFSDNNELARFKAFKGEFENALEMASRNINKHEKAQDSLKNRLSEVGQHKKELVHSQINKVGNEVGKRRVSPESSTGPSSHKKPKA